MHSSCKTGDEGKRWEEVLRRQRRNRKLSVVEELVPRLFIWISQTVYQHQQFVSRTTTRANTHRGETCSHTRSIPHTQGQAITRIHREAIVHTHGVKRTHIIHRDNHIHIQGTNTLTKRGGRDKNKHTQKARSHTHGDNRKHNRTTKLYSTVYCSRTEFV